MRKEDISIGNKIKYKGHNPFNNIDTVIGITPVGVNIKRSVPVSIPILGIFYDEEIIYDIGLDNYETVNG